MIFVSVGTNELHFNRLVKSIDLIANDINISFTIQIGYSTYIPKNARWLRFCSPQMMKNYINNCELLICQAGFGIIGEGIRYQKPMILVPREKKYHEAVNPQYELAEYLSSQEESIFCVRDVSLLKETVQLMLAKRFLPNYKYRSEIPLKIYDFIRRYEKIM